MAKIESAAKSQIEAPNGIQCGISLNNSATLIMLVSNARDQRRRAVGAPLALVASGVTTSADRCIAWLGNSGHALAESELDLEAPTQRLNRALNCLQRD